MTTTDAGEEVQPLVALVCPTRAPTIGWRNPLSSPKAIAHLLENV